MKIINNSKNKTKCCLYDISRGDVFSLSLGDDVFYTRLQIDNNIDALCFNLNEDSLVYLNKEIDVFKVLNVEMSIS